MLNHIVDNSELQPILDPAGVIRVMCACLPALARAS